MTDPGEDAPDPYDDAMMAIRLLAHDPVGLGGIVLRGGGEMRDAIVMELRTMLPEGASVRRLPTNIDDERLLGGLDLGATLASGSAVRQAGLLAEADGGLIVIPMAERLAAGIAARIAGAIEAGESRFAVVAWDDGLGEDEAVPAALVERLAFRVDLSSVPRRRPGPSCGGEDGSAPDEPEGSSRLGPGLRRGTPLISEEILHAIAATAVALGIDSARASLFALTTARASAALAGRDQIAEQDVILAVRLVLAPRATRIPATDDVSSDNEAPPSPPENDGGEDERGEPEPLADIVLEAALAALPKDVLARIAAGRGRKTARAKGAGEKRKSVQRGRPLGARAGLPRGGLRLSLIDTLRAAAPWQKLRGGGGEIGGGRVQIRRDDLRIRRFETRAEAVTIFAVDASGSSAMARLAEAKGAVELLLAEAYVKRAQVALVAFRGTSAETLLPPTRSLARAKRSLAELPGGGGTPLAAGLNAARELAESEKARGRTPFVVVLTDGRANIAADGGMVRKAAEDDAEAAARAIGVAGIAAAFVDISARPRPEGARLALAMGARYLPLPRADAAAMHAAVSAAQSK